MTHSELPIDQAFRRLGAERESLWSNLALLRPNPDRGPSVVFGAPRRDAGTTLVAAAAALGLARNLRVEVTLVEADLREPSVAGYLGLSPGPGLSEVLLGEAELDGVLRSVPGCPWMRVLQGGRARESPPGEFATAEARALIARLVGDGSYVVFDSPPILDHPESRVLLEYVDGLVLVLRARTTLTRDARRALELVEQVGVPVLGAVFNRYKSDMPLGFRSDGA